MPSLKTATACAATLGLALLLAGCGEESSMSSTPSSSTGSAASQPAATPTSRWDAAQLASLKAKYGDLQESTSGLLYRIITPGDGVTKPKPGQRVRTHYTGTFPDGKVFDSSVTRGQPFEFVAGVKQVIPAWDEAIQAMSKGEKRIIVAPYQLAYGERGAGGVIPPRATLVFEMELLEIVSQRLPGT